MPSSPIESPVSAFHWNAAGWFGGQIGCTSWLFIGSMVLRPVDPLTSWVWLGSFALANVLGLLLWRQRRRLRAHTAFQFFLFGTAVLSLVSMATADWSGHLPDLVNGAQYPRAVWYGALLIIPVLMLNIQRTMRSYSSNNAST